MPSRYNEQAMLAKAPLYSPAHLAQHQIRPGDLILVRRIHPSWQSSTLLLVAEVNVGSSDPLIDTIVGIISPSELPEHLRAHLLRIHDADNTMKSHLVRQGLLAMAEHNETVTPLAQYVSANDRVFVRPAGGSIRKYLLDDQCPVHLCQDGACVGRAQIYQRFPSLGEGMQANALRMILSGSGSQPMLCPVCYGLRLVRRTEKNRIATTLIKTGAHPQNPIIMERLSDHADMIRYFHQLELGYNPYNDPIYSALPIEPSPVSSPTDLPASFTSSPPREQPRTHQSVAQPAPIAREPERLVPVSQNPPVRTASMPVHPGRRSTEDQLESIRAKGAGHTLGNPRPSGSSGQTPAQRASHAARQRHTQRRGSVSVEVLTSPATITESMLASTDATTSSHRVRTTCRRSNVRQQHTPAQEQRNPTSLTASSRPRTAAVTSSSAPPPRQPTIEELIRAPHDTAVPEPPLTSTPPTPSPGWEEIPPQLLQQWQTPPTWTPVPSTLQQEWTALPEWEPIPQHIQQQIEEEGHQPTTTTTRTTRNALLKMARSRFKNWSKRKRNLAKAKDACVICLKAFGEGGGEEFILTTICGHDFHDECVREWFGRSDRCPLCRKVME